MNPITNQQDKTHGNTVAPCPYCGCPDEFDHTAECPTLPEVVALQRRARDLERNQAILVTALEGTIKQCMELAKLVTNIVQVIKKELKL
jgi:hypothetical protein